MLEKLPNDFHINNWVYQNKLFALVNNLVEVVTDLRTRLSESEDKIAYLESQVEQSNS